MDTDMVKCAREDQMEMMMMMMEMENFPGFNCVNELPSNDFNATMVLDSFPVANPSPANNHHHHSSFSFLGGSADQEQAMPQNFSGSHAGRLRNGEFPGATWQKQGSVAAMREMIFRIAAMQPIHIDPESVKPPKRRNVKISKDPQSIAARHRRERISERIRILQRLVPGGTKMDTASMLDEAIHYVKFLKTQVQSLERAAVTRSPQNGTLPVGVSSGSYMSWEGLSSNTKFQAHPVA